MRYYLISGKDLISHNTDMHNKAYDFWYNFWSSIYKQAGSSYKPVADDFIRQDVIACVVDEGKIIGQTAHGFYNINCKATLNHSYFKFYNDQFYLQLKEKNVQTVMTQEALAVHPDYRKSKLGFSLGATLFQIATYIFNDSYTDAAISTARNDVGASVFLYDQNYSCIEKDTKQRNFSCDLIACLRGKAKPSQRPKIAQMSKLLWDERIVLSDSLNYLKPTGRNLELAS